MSATVRKMKMAELHAENERLRDERNAMMNTNVELLRITRSLTAERNAWREDADSLRKYADCLSGCSILAELPRGRKCNCGRDVSVSHHRQLHERYPTEKSDTDKGE